MAARAGIHVNQAKRLVAHDFQDVGVTADKEAGPQPPEFLAGSCVVIAWIAPDVRHVYADALAFPDEIPRQVSTQLRAVNVPVNSAQEFKVSQSIQYFERPEISRVPYLIAFGKVLEDGVIEKAMGVGEQPDSHSPSYRRTGHRDPRLLVLAFRLLQNGLAIHVGPNGNDESISGEFMRGVTCEV